MRNRFVQIRIKFFSLCFNCLQSIFGEEIIELFQHESHPGINRRLFAFASRGFQTKLEIVDDRHQPLQQRSVRIFTRFFFFAGTALFIIFKVGLAAQCKIAKAVEISLQTGHRILCFASLRLGCSR